jgi:hypothetical protein
MVSREGLTPFNSTSRQLIRLLLDNEADTNLKDKFGTMAVNWVCSSKAAAPFSAADKAAIVARLQVRHMNKRILYRAVR